MAFEWDERKRDANMAKHGIDFEDAARVFLGRVLEAEDRRQDYGERRVQTLGEVDGRVLLVVSTRRGAVCRIISARKAGRDERKAYYASLSRSAAGNEG